MVLRVLVGRRSALHLAALVAVCCAPRLEAQGRYEAIDVGALVSGFSAANGIGPFGAVVGRARWPGTSGDHPFLFNGSRIYDLGTIGGVSADAEDANGSGWVVGGTGSPQKPFLWTYVPGMVLLPTLGGEVGRAHGVNMAGDIVGGASISGDGEHHAVLWPRAGGITDLGMLPGEGCSFAMATDLNDSGVIVGYSEREDADGGYPYRAFRWTAATGMVDLGTLGGPGSDAYGVNGSGWVAGSADLASGAKHAFLHNGSQMVDLGTLSEGDEYNSVAYDVNDKGQVVGYSDMADGRTHGFLWQNGQMIDLDTLLINGEGWHIDCAYGINPDGWIACRGSTPRSPGTATVAMQLRVVSKTASKVWVRSLFGNPGTSVQLAGVLMRASDGRRVHGRTLRFTIGTWQASGVTDAQGTAYVDYTVPTDAVLGSTRTIQVEFTDAADLDYHPSSGTGTLTIGKMPTTMWVRSTSGEPGKPVQLAGVLRRESDLVRVPGRTLTFRVGAWQGSGVTDAQGTVLLNYPVPADTRVGSTHPVTVEFTNAADLDYGTCSGQGTLTIGKVVTRLWVRTQNGEPGQTVQLAAALLRAHDGARISGRALTFSIGDWTGQGVTDAQGVVYLDYTVPPTAAPGGAPLSVNVAFSDAADPLYKTCAGSGCITVVRARTWVWVRSLGGARGQTVQLCGVLLRLNDGARVAGRTLNFSIGGWQGSGVTDARGAVYLNYPVPAGATLGGHAIDVAFTTATDAVYLTSSGTGSLTVTP